MRQSQQAFTLIELMVVMAIMTVIFSLIGPLAQNQVDKVRASEEWYTLAQSTNRQVSNAYLLGQSVILDFSGNKLTVRREDRHSEQYQFQFIQFNAQRIIVNSNGFPDEVVINAKLRGVDRQLYISELRQIAGNVK